MKMILLNLNTSHLGVFNMKHQNYTQNAIEGPYIATPTRADKVIFWLTGFAAGFMVAILVGAK